MSQPAILVDKLSKAYRIGLKDEVPDTLVSALTGFAQAPFRKLRELHRLNTFQHNGDAEDVIWALKDVSFEVAEGEVLGVIGRNGAGKSTLLKILSRITEPTRGRAVIRGRVSSLLEVGTGFHPELTGRENVYMNGTILGMTKREIDRNFDEIVDFSGVEKFLDTPVKRYSSGMTVRLAFAVAAHLEPEILIIDEVLAVGDSEFQKKCLGKMRDVARSGRTVMFVSHNMASVRSLTSMAVYLQSGRLVHQGTTDDTINVYLAQALSKTQIGVGGSLDYFRRNLNPSSPVRFSRVWLESPAAHNGSLPKVHSGMPITICAEIESTTTQSEACLSLTLVRNQEQCVVTFFSRDAGFNIPIAPGRQQITCHVERLPFVPGTYTLNCGINKNAMSTAFDVLLDLPLFEVVMPELEGGKLDWSHRPWGAVHWDDVKWQQR